MGEFLNEYLLPSNGDEVEEEPNIEEALQDCDFDQVFKLKQSKVESERKYTEDLFDYKTLFELVLIADTKVT